ncbi:MAG: alkaline phosphatase family protein, partial [bacterium]|nr:alkaline phosphatase family protein [bacterium]
GGMLSPDLNSEFISPSELKKEFFENNPDYQIFHLSKIKEEFSFQDLPVYIKELQKIIGIRTKAAKYLFSRILPDVMMVHFQVTDIIQHPYWKNIDKSHKDFNQKKYNLIGKEFYSFLDEHIQEVIDHIKEKNPGINIVVVSDHGFQPHEKRINLGDFLEDSGFTVRNFNKIKTLKGLFIRGLNKIDLFKLMKKLFKEKWAKTYERYSQQIMWSESPFIAIGRSSYGFIYLNPVFKDDKETLIKKLIVILPDLNKKAGGKVVHSIVRKEIIYSGSRLDKLPDILVIPENSITFSGTYSDIGKGNLPVDNIDDFHQGIHRLQGIYILNGPNVKKGFTADISITDIYPTLSGILELQIPNVDGTCKNELLEK